MNRFGRGGGGGQLSGRYLCVRVQQDTLRVCDANGCAVPNPLIRSWLA